MRRRRLFGDRDVSLHLQRRTDEVIKNKLEMLLAAGSNQPTISLLTR